MLKEREREDRTDSLGCHNNNYKSGRKWLAQLNNVSQKGDHRQIRIDRVCEGKGRYGEKEKERDKLTHFPIDDMDPPAHACTSKAISTIA